MPAHRSRALVVLERGSGWHWGWSLLHGLGNDCIVLVEQDDELGFDFARRVQHKISQLAAQSVSVSEVVFALSLVPLPPVPASYFLGKMLFSSEIVERDARLLLMATDADLERTARALFAFAAALRMRARSSSALGLELERASSDFAAGRTLLGCEARR